MTLLELIIVCTITSIHWILWLNLLKEKERKKKPHSSYLSPMQLCPLMPVPVQSSSPTCPHQGGRLQLIPVGSAEHPCPPSPPVGSPVPQPKPLLWQWAMGGADTSFGSLCPRPLQSPEAFHSRCSLPSHKGGRPTAQVCSRPGMLSLGERPPIAKFSEDLQPSQALAWLDVGTEAMEHYRGQAAGNQGKQNKKR